MFLGRFPIFDISVNGKYTSVCKVDAAITSQMFLLDWACSVIYLVTATPSQLE